MVVTVLGVMMALGATQPAYAQTAGSDVPLPTTPPAAPVEPLPSAAAPTSPVTAPPAAVGQPALAAEPTGTVPVPEPPHQDRPIYERWWFWTAIGAFAVTAVVIVAASSGPSTPRTDLGNMPAF